MSLGDILGVSQLSKVRKYLAEVGIGGACGDCVERGSCGFAATLSFAGCLEYNPKPGTKLPRIPEEVEPAPAPKPHYEPPAEPQPVFVSLKSIWAPPTITYERPEPGVEEDTGWAIPSIFVSQRGTKWVRDLTTATTRNPDTGRLEPMSSRFYARQLQLDPEFTHCGQPTLIFQWSSLAPLMRVCMVCRMFLTDKDLEAEPS